MTSLTEYGATLRVVGVQVKTQEKPYEHWVWEVRLIHPNDTYRVLWSGFGTEDEAKEAMASYGY